MGITAAQVERWRDEGALVVNNFLDPSTVDQLRAHLRKLYWDDPEHLHGPDSPHTDPAGFSPAQFAGVRMFPYAGDRALNLAGLDPRLLAAARIALATDDVLMHQNLVQIKHFGAANYEQPLHLDYPLHTLLAPAEQAPYRAVIFTIFLTDVGPDDGPFCFVPKRHTTHLDASRSVLSWDETRELAPHQRLLTVPAGTLVMYGPDDVYHRGTDITRPGRFRWTLTSSFFAADCWFVGGLRWAADGVNKDWRWFLPHASPEQLAAIGIPPPGHPYWTERTIAAVEHRYPDWDLRRWRKPMA